MNNLHRELFGIADRLNAWPQETESPDMTAPLDALEGAVVAIHEVWSGSWVGYHADVYYENFQSPPQGAYFSQVYGMLMGMETTGNWCECDRDAVRKEIQQIAGEPDIGVARKLAFDAQAAFETDKADVLSILTTALSRQEDTFISGIKEEVEQLEVFTEESVLNALRPTGTGLCQDIRAIAEGFRSPVHLTIQAEIIAIREAPISCGKLGQFALNAGRHLERQPNVVRRSQEKGTKIFIGHGHSTPWREVKDFIQDRLGLPWDEFNRTPVAGITNTDRLSEMLNDAALALVIMTGEDEQTDGQVHARMNVVHEAGLFQGRLGFTRAIVLLEEGCEEFSNIQGLGQIRFPKGNIKAAFEEIRLVLEREKIL